MDSLRFFVFLATIGFGFADLAWYNLQWPTSVDWVITTQNSIAIYAQYWHPGVIDEPDRVPDHNITCQVGWGNETEDPSLWSWSPTVYNTEYMGMAENDEYFGFIQPNKIGVFRFASRWSTDNGTTWVYGDFTGSLDGFHIFDTGNLTVLESNDTVPPEAPQNLTVSAGPTLSWVGIDNDIAGYDIYRNGAYLVTVSNVSSYTDSNAASVNYTYYVVAFDTSYNYGPSSNVVYYSPQTPSGNTNRTVTIPQCVQINENIPILGSIGGTFCTRIQFVDCAVTFAITLDNTTIYSPPPFHISAFKDVFQETPTCTPTILGCDFCTSWSNIFLNTTSASGCGSAQLKCAGLNLGPFPLGCFTNDQVIPTCFGSCPNNCNGKGYCDNGFCNCTLPWKGDDCSTTGCPNNCGGSIRGECVQDVCVCNEGFDGTDCNFYIGAETVETSPGPENWKLGVGIGIGIGVPVLIVIIAVTYFATKKKREKNLTFAGGEPLHEVELD